ncbi:MAG: hypothetical protein I3270_01730 [Candidatus Moeniiplasma glomeromycotorum]|nr:hypothetical protein [Candidatus Moeniiplasma glomeromycotorum]MCE8166353.1 hypothetical protein [Candidatus Moeniiplasma glomeromycotorum]MCE8166835.1 hypothetical protein [Candidatus Moeniiplasma glomeromycotorum]
MAGVEKMTLEELMAFRAKVGFLEVSGERLPGGWTEKNFGNEDRNRVKNYLQDKLNGLPREVEKKVKNKYPPATWKANIDNQNFIQYLPYKDTRLTKTRQDTVNIVNEILAFIYAYQQQEEYAFLINFLDGFHFTDSTYDNINWVGTLLRIKTAQQELEELSKDLKDLTKILNNLGLKKKRIQSLQEIYRLVFQDIEPAIINEILAQIEESFPNWRSDLTNLKNKSKKKGLVAEFEELAQKVRRKTITLNLELNFIRALKFFGKRNSGTPLLPADLAEARGVKEAFRKVKEQETAGNQDVIFVLQSVMGWEGGEVPKIKTDLENYDREEYGGDKNYKTLIYKIIHELNMVVAQNWLNNLITNNINDAGEAGHPDNGGRNIGRLVYHHTAAADAADDIDGVLVGDIEIRDFPNLTEINFKGVRPHKSRLTRVTIINCPNLTKINVENNLLAANGLDLSQSGADGAVAAGLLFLDVSDNTNLTQLDLRGFVNLTQVDLQGTAIDTQQIKGISEIERMRNWNGGFNMGGTPLADGIQDKTFLNGVKAELNAKEVEAARVVLSDLIGGVGFTHAQFIAELIKNPNAGGAGATAALGGPLVAVVGDEAANQDTWQTWVRRNPDHKIAALKVLKLLTIERITLPLYTKSDPNQIKARLNAPNDQGGWNEGIADGVDLLAWLRNLNGIGGGADTVEDLDKKERKIYDAEIQLQQAWDTQNEIETFITGSGGAFTDAHFKAELRKTIVNGGADARAADDIANDTHDLDNTDGHDADDWKVWLNRDVDTLEEWRAKKRDSLKILARLRAITRLDALRIELGVNHIPFVQKLKLPANQGGINAAGGTAEDTEDNARDAWKALLNGPVNAELVKELEAKMARSLGVVKGADPKVAALAEIQVQRNAHNGLAEVPYNDLIAALVDAGEGDGANPGEFNTGRDEAALTAWINHGDAGETTRRLTLALKQIAKIRAITRLDALRIELGVNHIPFVQKLKLPANQGGINAAGGTAEDTEDNARDAWKALLNGPVNAELVKELEAKMARSLGVVKGADPKVAALAEIQVQRNAHNGLAEVPYNDLIAALVDAGEGDGANPGEFNTGRDEAALTAWINHGDAGETTRRLTLALKQIAKIRAITRLDALRIELGVNHIPFVQKLKLPANQGGINAAGGTAEDTEDNARDAWKALLNGPVNAELVKELEAKMARSLGVVKGEVDEKKEIVITEIIRLLTLSTLTDAQFKAELRKATANGGANAANDATAGNTHDLANTINEREDWQNWLKRPADSDVEFTAKKTNSLRILHRVLAQTRISDYLAHGIVRTDNDLTTEIDKEIGTGEGVRNAGDPNITDWKVWLAQAPDLDEVMIREGKLMKAASAIKNSDYKEVLLKRLCDTIDKYNVADNAILAGKNYANIIENTYTDTNDLKAAVETLNTNPVKYMEKVRELATKFYAEINKVTPTGSTKPRNEETPLDLLDQKAVNEQTWQKVKDVLPPLTPDELRTELITQGKFPGGTALISLEDWVKSSKSLLTTIKAWADVTDTIQKLKEKPHIQQLSVVATELGITGTIDAAKLAPFKNAAGQVTSLQNQLNQATQAQTTLETKLGVKLAELDAKLGTKKLSDIPAGKTLQDLIENPDAPGLQAQIDQLNTKLNTKEKEVVKSIHDELQLGLASGEIDKTQVLTAIKNLIAKGGGGSEEDRAKITRLESEIASLKSQPDTVVKEVIVEKIIEKEAEKTYGVKFTTEEIAKISAAANAQEALTITNQIVKEKVGNLQDSQKSAYMLNWILGGLTAASLVALAYLLVKGSSSLPAPEKKEEKKN